MSMLAAGLAPAQAATASGWKITATIGTETQNANALGLVATGAHNAWSLWLTCKVGAQCDDNMTQKVLAHWNGSTWSQRRPAALQTFRHLVAFGASSASNVWVFNGQTGPAGQADKSTTALRWNGSTWTRHTVPSWVIRRDAFGSQHAQASVFSPTNLWVFTVGGERTPSPRLAGHYNGHQWVKHYLPVAPVEVSAVSRSDIWADGWNSNGPVLMHWNGTTWSSRQIPAALSPSGQIRSIYNLTATGPSSVSMLGVLPGTAPGSAPTYLLHWNGTTWQKVLVPANVAAGLAPDGHGGWWTISVAENGRDSFLHRSSGHWTSSRVPTLSRAPLQVMNSLIRVPGTTTILADGDLTALTIPGLIGAIWQHQG